VQNKLTALLVPERAAGAISGEKGAQLPKEDQQVIANAVAIVAFLAAAALLLRPRFRDLPAWRATVTPLASIIGSGFLVSLPILANDVGAYALPAMMALVAASYLLGGAIRFNIIHGEPLFDAEGQHGAATALERVSHVALAVAYFISVAYYLSLLSAFFLKLFGLTGTPEARVLTTAILWLIGGYGWWRGLRGLEVVEEYAVGLKLAVIAAVLAALAWYNAELFASGDWALPTGEPDFSWDTVRLLFGLLIVVQGFETSRFLKGAYPPAVRVRTMRRAQLISAGIYAAFFALATVLIGSQAAYGDVTAITNMVVVAASVLPVMLIAGAVFAQLSAAVADAIGGAGLIEQFGIRLVSRQHAYLVIAAIGTLLIWTTHIFEIIALASRAFALFYFLQCLVAAFVALTAPDVNHRAARVTGFLALGAFAALVMLFGIPAETG